MNLKSIVLYGSIILFGACTNTPSKVQTEPATADIDTSIDIANAAKTDLANCYRYIHNRDTVLLHITNQNGKITGDLMYNFYEKDRNKGTIEGELKGDMLIAGYTFNSEGSESFRTVAFKKLGGNLVEGYGEQIERNGRLVFKNTDSLSFEHSIVLKPYECDK